MSTEKTEAKPWRVLIADDEPAARRGVRQLLAPHASFAVAGECRNGAEVLRSLDTLRPDLVFLDIQMPDLGGFDVIARRTSERMPLVVFLTAYDEHALKAFDADAVDYLVKPVSQSRFDAAIRRVTKRLKVRVPVAPPRLVVTTPRGAVVIPVREVDWIEAAGNYAKIWTGGKSYLLRESLDDLETRVGAHGFARAHRGALVRLSNVRRLIPSTDGQTVAELQSGVKIRLSRRRRAKFVRSIGAQG